MPKPFGDRLAEAVSQKKCVAVVGIDPVLENLPPEAAEPAYAKTGGIAEALTIFGIGIVESVKDVVPAVKPNIAFFEAYGILGMVAYNAICAHAAAQGLIVIGDIKRGDIGSTAAAYAKGHIASIDESKDNSQNAMTSCFGPCDALTLNPYLGTDSLKPFAESSKETGQGYFVLVKTSNPSSSELQDLELKAGYTVAEASAELVNHFGKEYIGKSGLSNFGAVIGATHPLELHRYREIMPNAPFLVPGYGAQGGTADDIVGAFREDGSGALVNASRSVIYAWKKEENPQDWRGAATRAAEKMRDDLASALQKADKWSF